MVSCEVSLNLLQSIEEQLVESTLANLDLKESLEESKEEVLRMLGKSTQADEMRRRERWISGLITEEDFAELRTIFSLNNQTKKFIGVLWKNWMKEIYERIWVARCKLVQEWEKENGITSKDKRNSHKKLKGKRKKKREEKNPDKPSSKKGKKEEKEKRWNVIFELSKEEVLRWILTGYRANWWKTEGQS